MWNIKKNSYEKTSINTQQRPLTMNCRIRKAGAEGGTRFLRFSPYCGGNKTGTLNTASNGVNLLKKCLLFFNSIIFKTFIMKKLVFLFAMMFAISMAMA